MKGRHPEDSRVILSQPMGVTEANILGNIHGGIIMKLCDEAGAIAAMKHAHSPVVTVAVDSMSFHSPVHIGNLLTVQAEVTWAGRTSMETRILVTAENMLAGTITHTNTAYFVYVALDDDGRPIEIPPLICQTDDERQLYEEGASRQARRLERRVQEENLRS
ncbi:MAG: acyl-CoA thioesterase [Chloroflexota bacterium]|jgi:uncharacterized protein (TIGR00369 family)